MSSIILGIGELGSSRTPGDEVKTLGLGSCVAVIVLDPQTHAVGMVHVALPDSGMSTPDVVKAQPGRFADTAVQALLADMKKLGATQVPGMIIKLVGGASVMDAHNTFNIGKRNILALKKSLWNLGLGARAEDVGKNISRSVSVSVDTGRVIVRSPGRGEWAV
jgi:chemotaxis protein CheD